MKGEGTHEDNRGSDVVEIRVRGHLHDRWADWFGGMTIVLEESGDTTMTGPIVDQAALHGLLKKVRDLGMPLLSVNRVLDDSNRFQGKEKEMTSERKAAVTVGILFIVGTVVGVICRALSGPYDGAQDLLGAVSANGTNLVLAASCWLAMGLVLAMVPVVMYPILRKQNEVLALGYVVFRGGLETMSVIGGVVSWLLLLPLGQVYRVGSADAGSLNAFAAMLLNVEAIGSIGSIVFCIGTMMFNFLLFRSRLIPRWIAAWGFLAALPYLAAAALAMAGMLDQSSTVSIVLDVPLALQEMLLAVWFIAKGFHPTALASLAARKA